MSASTIAPASAIESPDWQFAEEDAPKPASLIVQLRRSAVVFPWFRFVYAEGTNAAVEIVFATHAVRVTGNGLAPFLVAIAGQRVIRIMEPSENEAQFGVRGPGASQYSGPAIHSITVNKFE